MNTRIRGAIGSLALAALLGATLTGIPAQSAAAQDTTTPAATETPQGEADAAAAALSETPNVSEIEVSNGLSEIDRLT